MQKKEIKWDGVCLDFVKCVFVHVSHLETPTPKGDALVGG